MLQSTQYLIFHVWNLIHLLRNDILKHLGNVNEIEGEINYFVDLNFTNILVFKESIIYRNILR